MYLEKAQVLFHILVVELRQQRYPRVLLATWLLTLLPAQLLTLLPAQLLVLFSTQPLTFLPAQLLVLFPAQLLKREWVAPFGLGTRRLDMIMEQPGIERGAAAVNGGGGGGGGGVKLPVVLVLVLGLLQLPLPSPFGHVQFLPQPPLLLGLGGHVVGLRGGQVGVAAAGAAAIAVAVTLSAGLWRVVQGDAHGDVRRRIQGVDKR